MKMRLLLGTLFLCFSAMQLLADISVTKSLTFDAVVGGGDPSPQTATITLDKGDDVTALKVDIKPPDDKSPSWATAKSDPAHMTVDATTGKQSVPLIVTPTIKSLLANAYSETITVSEGSKSAPLEVTLKVASQLLLQPVVFDAIEGGSDPSPLTVTLTLDKDDSVDGLTFSGAPPWAIVKPDTAHVTVNAATGKQSVPLIVTPTIKSLPANTYKATINVSEGSRSAPLAVTLDVASTDTSKPQITVLGEGLVPNLSSSQPSQGVQGSLGVAFAIKYFQTVLSISSSLQPSQISDSVQKTFGQSILHPGNQSQALIFDVKGEHIWDFLDDEIYGNGDLSYYTNRHVTNIGEQILDVRGHIESPVERALGSRQFPTLG